MKSTRDSCTLYKSHTSYHNNSASITLERKPRSLLQIMYGVTLLVLLELPRSDWYHSPLPLSTHIRHTSWMNHNMQRASPYPQENSGLDPWSGVASPLEASLTSIWPRKSHTLPGQLCHRYRYLGESIHETSILTDQTREIPHLGYTRRSNQFSTASILPGFTKIPSFPITCPRKATCGTQNSHLLNLAYKRCSHNRCSTSLG